MILPIINNERLYQKIANIIIKLIDNGTFLSGDCLPPERELSKSLGVSRSSLREALIALEISGFIEIRSSYGVVVLDRQKKRENYPMLDLLKTREIIDSETAFYAAKSDTELKIKLTELYSLMNFYIETDDVGNFYRIDKEFHMCIAQLSNNKVLCDIVDLLWQGRIELPYAELDEQNSDREVLLKLNAQHYKIAHAILNSDAELAKQESLNHLVFVEELWLSSND